MKYLWVSWVLLMFVSPAWGAATDQDLEQANATFRYQDNPIHPGLVMAFHNWEADYRPPIVTMVDVGAAYNTNEFYEPVQTGPDAKVMIKLDDGGSFSYRHLGRVAEDIHVLHTLQNYPGTGVSQTVTFVKFGLQNGFDRDGLNPSKRLMMSAVRVYLIVGRQIPDVFVGRDFVEVENKSGRTMLSFSSN